MILLKKSIFVFLILLMIVTVPVNLVNALEEGTGLEVEEPKIWVGIEVEIPTDNNTGITKELIRSKVETKLRQNDIKVLNNLNSELDYYLGVSIRTLTGDLNNGTAYNIKIEMRRNVIYKSNNVSFINYGSSVWSREALGVGEKENIINMTENGLDIFINEFYRANNF